LTCAGTWHVPGTYLAPSYDGKPVGVLTRSDLLAYLAHDH